MSNRTYVTLRLFARYFLRVVITAQAVLWLLVLLFTFEMQRLSSFSASMFLLKLLLSHKRLDYHLMMTSPFFLPGSLKPCCAHLNIFLLLEYRNANEHTNMSQPGISGTRINFLYLTCRPVSFSSPWILRSVRQLSLLVLFSTFDLKCIDVSSFGSSPASTAH